MAYLFDTGILLRLANKGDNQHSTVRDAVRILIADREELLIATQNVAEFCNVATRPIANNGLGLFPKEALNLLGRDIEPICKALVERETSYHELKRLIATYSVRSKQVHDARLVAMMLAWQIENILTLNDRDFRRYEPEGITVVTPAELISSA
ncbi:MAG: PIN domain-containing protein [Bythopirellula sp.]|nr:PIN domain-containing protein [Bythopirellula sp.]